MREFRTPNGMDVYQFDSMKEVSAIIDPTLFVPREKGVVGETIPTWDAAERRINRDWAEGMYIINQFVERLRKADLPEIKSRKRTTHFHESEGDEIDLDRLRNGQNFWRTSERETVSGPTTATIVIDVTTPSFVSSTDIFWRGAAALALTMILEEKGYAVELWVVDFTRGLYVGNPTHKLLTACCLKRCSDPLDMSTLANSVAGWFYRTVQFTLLTSIAKRNNQTAVSWLGAALAPNDKDMDCLSIDPVRVYSSGVFTFNGALSLIQSELERITAVEPDTKK